MKSYGHLWKQIISENNLHEAWWRVRRGHGDSAAVLNFESALDENIAALWRDLSSCTYEPGCYRQFRVMDPKPRVISCAPVRDRIVHHALCGVIAPILEKSFSHSSFACRQGYGSHRECARARCYARRHAYFCKMDIRHYFDSILHDRLLGVLLPRFRENEVKELVARIVRHPVPGQADGRGLPIGNLTSQWFINDSHVGTLSGDWRVKESTPISATLCDRHPRMGGVKEAA